MKSAARKAFDSYIYSITNTEDGAVYIGCAGHPVTQRWSQHTRLLRKGEHHCRELQEAFWHFGLRAFSFGVVMQCQSADVFDLEREVIAQQDGAVYNRITPEKPFEYRRRAVIEESRRQAIIEAVGKRVRCLDTGDEFETIRAAAKWLIARTGCDASLNSVGGRISSACDSPRTRSTLGHRFVRANDTRTGDDFGPLAPLEKRRGKPPVRVRCVETGEEFPSIRDAADWLLAATGRGNKRVSAASMICISASREGAYSAYGYRFKRVEKQLL